MPPAGFRWLSADEWDSSGDLWMMLHNVIEHHGEGRKFCLFGAACCSRHCSSLLPRPA